MTRGGGGHLFWVRVFGRVDSVVPKVRNPSPPLFSHLKFGVYTPTLSQPPEIARFPDVFLTKCLSLSDSQVLNPLDQITYLFTCRNRFSDTVQ